MNRRDVAIVSTEDATGAAVLVWLAFAAWGAVCFITGALAMGWWTVYQGGA